MNNYIIAFLAFLLIATNVSADVNVLLVGSTHDTSEFNTSASSTPFSPTPTSIATYLENILDAADPGTVNVSTRERYATGISSLGDTTYAFNQASWLHWPYPKGSESSRGPDLKGEATILPRGATSKWLSTDNRASWKLRVNHPGECTAVVQTFGRRRVAHAFGNHEVQVSIGGSNVSGIAGAKDLDMHEDAPGPQNPDSIIGTITIDDLGDQQLDLAVTKLDETASQGFNLAAVKLIPME